MPGAHLTNDERSMLKEWNERKGQFLALRSITISPGTQAVPLRGISDLRVDFGFPVSVLVGANGSGKTTMLSLAALGYNGNGHVPHGRGRAGYTFMDFFARTNSEAIPIDITVAWEYSDHSEIQMRRKTPKKWMHYDRRVPRPVQFIGLSRIADLSESLGHRRMFSAPGGWATVALKSEIASDMTRVLKRKYDSAENFASDKLRLPVLHAVDSYSAFNMGTGEAALLEILSVLHTVPKGSLVLIEEVELGIHSEALTELARVIVSIAKSRKLQVVCTSHSEWFIDALPREARILLTRGAHSHSSITGVTTRAALTNLGGLHTPEARIVCEDVLAKRLLELSLTIEERRKFQIIPMGAKTLLASAARVLRLQDRDVPVVIIWDCDVTDSDVRQYYTASDLGNASDNLHKKVEWCRLPGATDEAGIPLLDPNGKLLPPEEAIRATILARSGSLARVAERLRATSTEEFETHLQSVALGEGEHHGLFRQLAIALAHSEESVRDIMLTEYSDVADWSLIHDRLRQCLDGSGKGFVEPSLPNAGNAPARECELVLTN